MNDYRDSAESTEPLDSFGLLLKYFNDSVEYFDKQEGGDE